MALKEVLTPAAAVAFVAEQGIVLISAKGRVPTLTEAITGTPVRGSWWGHPQGKQIFRILEAVRKSNDVLVCRLVDGKLTLVHRRLWPALVRVASRFPARSIARVVEEHTSSGRHRTVETPLLEWIPGEIRRRAKRLTAAEALQALGEAHPGSGTAARRSPAARRRRRRK